MNPFLYYCLPFFTLWPSFGSFLVCYLLDSSSVVAVSCLNWHLIYLFLFAGLVYMETLYRTSDHLIITHNDSRLKVFKVSFVNIRDTSSVNL